MIRCKDCTFWVLDESRGIGTTYGICKQGYGNIKNTPINETNWSFGCTESEADIRMLIGKTLTAVLKTKEDHSDDDLLVFRTDRGKQYELYHDQGCCESVWLEEVVGCLEDLVDSPILKASEDTNANDPGQLNGDHESYTWTFYNIATAKGHVTLRWYGTSNGYYSESVTFKQVGE